MPIYLLSSIKSLPPEISRLQELKKMLFGYSESEWMIRLRFMSWAKPFVEFANSTNISKEKKILYLDSHNSRENYEALSNLRANNIVVITYPPHTTHILQPFDTAIARSFKALIKKNYRINEGSDLALERFMLFLAIEAAWNGCITYKSAITAFSMTGIYPFDECNPLNSQYTVKSESDLEMEQQRNRMRTTSQELTSDSYLMELKQRNLFSTN